MKRWFENRAWRSCTGTLLLAAVCLSCGCTAQEPPEPAQTKEERRLQEKEMLQREMRNE